MEKLCYRPHSVISCSHTFAGRPVADLKLDPSIPHKYSQPSETKGKSVLCVPSARNAKAIDALLQPYTGFQITRNLHHPLSGNGIRDWLACLDNEDAARIIFCVPANLYSRYKKQNAFKLAPEYHFEQYVVKIDVNVFESA